MAKYPLASSLTAEFVAELKRTLHRQLPSVKSSHLSEGIASGLGYQTAAALQAALKSTGEASATLDGEAMAKRLVDLGYAELRLGITVAAHLVSLMKSEMQPRSLKVVSIGETVEYAYDDLALRPPLPENDIKDVLRGQAQLHVVLPAVGEHTSPRKDVLNLVDAARKLGFVFTPSAITEDGKTVLVGEATANDSKSDSFLGAASMPFQGIGSKRSRDDLVDTLVQMTQASRTPTISRPPGESSPKP